MTSLEPLRRFLRDRRLVVDTIVGGKIIMRSIIYLDADSTEFICPSWAATTASVARNAQIASHRARVDREVDQIFEPVKTWAARCGGALVAVGGVVGAMALDHVLDAHGGVPKRILKRLQPGLNSSSLLGRSIVIGSEASIFWVAGVIAWPLIGTHATTFAWFGLRRLLMIEMKRRKALESKSTGPLPITAFFHPGKHGNVNKAMDAP